MIDETAEFLKGALLGYSHQHTPEEVGNLLEHVLRYSTQEYALSLGAYVTTLSIKECILKEDKT